MKKIALLIVLLPLLALGQTYQKVYDQNTQLVPLKQVNQNLLSDRNYLPSTGNSGNDASDFRTSSTQGMPW